MTKISQKLKGLKEALHLHKTPKHKRSESITSDSSNAPAAALQTGSLRSPVSPYAQSSSSATTPKRNSFSGIAGSRTSFGSANVLSATTEEREVVTPNETVKVTTEELHLSKPLPPFAVTSPTASSYAANDSLVEESVPGAFNAPATSSSQMTSAALAAEMHKDNASDTPTSTIASFYSANTDMPFSNATDYPAMPQASASHMVDDEDELRRSINLDLASISPNSTPINNHSSNATTLLTQQVSTTQDEAAAGSMTVLPGIKEEATSFEREILRDIEQQQKRQIEEQAKLLAEAAASSPRSGHFLPSSPHAAAMGETVTATTNTVAVVSVDEQTGASNILDEQTMSSVNTTGHNHLINGTGQALNMSYADETDATATGKSAFDDAINRMSNDQDSFRHQTTNNDSTLQRDLADIFTRSRTPEMAAVSSPKSDVAQVGERVIDTAAVTAAATTETTATTVVQNEQQDAESMHATFENAAVNGAELDSSVLRSSPAPTPAERSLSRDFTALADVNAELQQSVEDLRRKLAEAQSTHEERFSTLSTNYQSELSATQQRHQQQLAALQQQVEELTAECDRKQWEMEGLRADIENNEKEIAMLNKDRESLVERLSQALKDREEALNEARIALQAEKQALQDQLAASQLEHSQFQETHAQQIQHFQRQVQEYEQHIQTITAAAAKPVVETVEQQVTVQAVDADADGIPDTAVTTERVTDTVAVPVGGAAATSSATATSFKKEESEESSTVVTELRLQVQQFQQTVEQKDATIAHLTEEISALQSHQAAHLEEVNRLNEQMNEQSRNMTKLSEHVTSSQAQLRESDEMIRQLQQTIAEMRRQPQSVQVQEVDKTNPPPLPPRRESIEEKETSTSTTTEQQQEQQQASDNASIISLAPTSPSTTNVIAEQAVAAASSTSQPTEQLQQQEELTSTTEATATTKTDTTEQDTTLSSAIGGLVGAADTTTTTTEQQSEQQLQHDRRASSSSATSQSRNERNLIRGVLDDLRELEYNATGAFTFVLNEVSSVMRSQPNLPGGPLAVLQHPKVSRATLAGLNDEFGFLDGLVSVIRYLASLGQMPMKDAESWMTRLSELRNVTGWVDASIRNEQFTDDADMSVNNTADDKKSSPYARRASMTGRNKVDQLLRGVHDLATENERLREWVGEWARLVAAM